MDFVKKYQARAPAERVAPLGCFLPPFAYSELQILGDAIAAAKTLDDDKLAEYLRSHPFHTIEDDIAFGPTANGPRRDRSGCSITASRGTTSSSSADRRRSRSWRPRNTKPVN
jgi:hypothetical protein